MLAEVAARLKRDYTVKVFITRERFKMAECAPSTWRRLRVSGAVTLNALADKARTDAADAGLCAVRRGYARAGVCMG